MRLTQEFETYLKSGTDIPIVCVSTKDFNGFIRLILPKVVPEANKRIVFNSVISYNVTSKGYVLLDRNENPEDINLPRLLTSKLISQGDHYDKLTFFFSDQKSLGEGGYQPPREILSSVNLLRMFYDTTHNFLISKSDVDNTNDDRSYYEGIIEEQNRLLQNSQFETIYDDEETMQKKSGRIVLVTDCDYIPTIFKNSAYYFGNPIIYDNTPVEARGLSFNESIALMNFKEAQAIALKDKLPENEISRKSVSFIRNSIYSGDNVVKEIPIEEPTEYIGGYRSVKAYTSLVRAYVQQYLDSNRQQPMLLSGILFVGPAGTGKSKIITSLPSAIGLPGYELDINSAMGRYQGDSEKNIISALTRLEELAPCIATIDEIEKVVAGTGEGEVAGNEVAQKVLGILLQYMSRDNNVYWLATANKVSHLPAPLLRKGRFDKMYFVDLPKDEERIEIADIHLKKCHVNKTLKDFDYEDEFAQSTINFVGAEIAHVIKEAAWQSTTLKNKDFLSILKSEISLVRPISNIKEREIKETKEWAKNFAENAYSRKRK